MIGKDLDVLKENFRDFTWIASQFHGVVEQLHEWSHSSNSHDFRRAEKTSILIW